MQKIKTGLKFLDENYILNKTYLSLLAGLEGTEKSVLIKEIIKSALKHGNKCVLFDLNNDISDIYCETNLKVFTEINNINKIEQYCNKLNELDIVVINGYENIVNLQTKHPECLSHWRLKVLAIRLNVLVISTITIKPNMLVEYENGKMSLSSLKEYGCIESTADQVFFLKKIKELDNKELLELDCKKSRFNYHEVNKSTDIILLKDTLTIKET